MVPDSPALPVAETSLVSYFTSRLHDHGRRLRPPPREDTCWYLANLLERLGRSEQLFAWEEGRFTLRPLAQLYGDAVEARSEFERCLLLQQLGDMALFVGALFPDRYARRGIHRDYFIGMGGGAYDYLADNARGNRDVFAELARTFARMLELVAEACSRVQQASSSDVLALYQRWLRNRDPVAERQLRALGVQLQGSERMQ